MKRLLLLLSVLLIAAYARGDEVHLARGGRLSGKLVEVRIKADGKVTTIKAAEIVTVKLRDEGDDLVTTKAGDRIKCVVEQVVIQTIGGAFKLARNKVSKVDLSLSKKEGNLKKYEEERKKLKLDDVEGRVALAEWCGKNGMKSEMRQEYQTCITIAPDDPRAPEWHKLAGLVQHEGKRLTPAEKKAGVQDEMQAKGMVYRNGKWIAKELNEQLMACAEKVKKRLDEAKIAVDEKYNEDKARLESEFKEKVKTLKEDIEKVEAEIKRLAKLQAEESARINRNRRGGTIGRVVSRYGIERAEKVDKLKQLKRKESSLARAAKRAVDRLRSARKRRLRALSSVKAKLKEMLQRHKVIDDATIDSKIAKAAGIE